MEIVGDKGLNQSAVEFHRQCSVSQNLGVALCVFLKIF
jgi:hypothetical protein